MRVLGIDLGSKRIGIAVSDSAGGLATPYDVVTRSGDLARDRRAVLALADEVEAEAIVVGLPLSLDGSLGPAARAALAEVDALAGLTERPVETYDERLTTVTADRSLREMGVKGEARKRVIDQVAAAVMLQAWLDSRPTAPPPGSGDVAPSPDADGEGQSFDARVDRVDPELSDAPSRPRRRRNRRPRA